MAKTRQNTTLGDKKTVKNVLAFLKYEFTNDKG
jgi:hypothetical protein